MKRQSLFSRIWHTALRRGENLSKLADDMGRFRGVFSYQRYNPVTGQILMKSEQHNTLVNNSKTTMIRLISQGISPWIGQIDPIDLKITRMRFGNASQFSSPSNLNYYLLTEPSTRPNIPLDDVFAGGGDGQATIPSQGLTTDLITSARSVTNYAVGPNSTKIYSISTLTGYGNNNPPSPPTLVVKFYLSSALQETVTFAQSVYTRMRLGNAPTSIVTATGSGINTPSGRPVTQPELSGTRLFYDYTEGSQGWKIKVDEIAKDEGRYDAIEIIYEIGKYNVIHSVVPKQGFNDGTGETTLNRYQGNIDYYNVIQDFEYRDAEADLIDDYAVTFSVNMTGLYGNGETDAELDEKIQYTEAFLFNGLDEMFSIVSMSTPFDKNESTAYYISWTLLAPLN